MARPTKCRCVECTPGALYFRPRGIPPGRLEEIRLRLDELEAVRLADCEGLHQEAAAARMKISRATFGRILDRAHGKIAQAVVCGKALRIVAEPVPGRAAGNPAAR